MLKDIIILIILIIIREVYLDCIISFIVLAHPSVFLGERSNYVVYRSQGFHIVYNFLWQSCFSGVFSDVYSGFESWFEMGDPDFASDPVFVVDPDLVSNPEFASDSGFARDPDIVLDPGCVSNLDFVCRVGHDLTEWES